MLGDNSLARTSSIRDASMLRTSRFCDVIQQSTGRGSWMWADWCRAVIGATCDNPNHLSTVVGAYDKTAVSTN